MVTSRQFVELLMTQRGTRYVLGAEASPANSNPSALDCSELVEWACDRLGVKPKMPDGAWYQYLHCKKYGKLIPVGSGISTQGALLFRVFGAAGSGGRGNHVAVSRGNGWTIEARGRAYGTNTFSANNRGWTHAALVPGINYDATAPAIPWEPDLPADAPLPESVKRKRSNKMDMIRNNIPNNPQFGRIFLITGGYRRYMHTGEQARDVRYLVGRSGGEFIEVESPAAWLHYMRTFPPLTPEDNV